MWRNTVVGKFSWLNYVRTGSHSRGRFKPKQVNVALHAVVASLTFLSAHTAGIFKGRQVLPARLRAGLHRMNKCGRGFHKKRPDSTLSYSSAVNKLSTRWQIGERQLGSGKATAPRVSTQT